MGAVVTTLFWSHVNPYGTFRLDMDKRLDLGPAAVLLRPRTPADDAVRRRYRPGSQSCLAA
ncbi:hypothetical protein AB0D91_43510 [Streptomyces canus]|uniref:hypothetical protein n=1 Tax=Streptomyces canus TaxID=58343 RepID=UPI0033E36189